MALLNGAGAAALTVALWGSDVSSQTIQLPNAGGATATAPSVASTFTNPIYTGQDPAGVFKDGYYYLCQSGPGNRIEIWKSRTLTERGERAVVWTAPRNSWNSRQVWAPEMHYLRGKWYIYYAASDGRNENHRMGVLEATTDDPQGAFVDRGLLYTGDHLVTKSQNRWAIDGHPFEHNGKLYFAWSGWEDHRDVQHLYIATMSDPVTVSSNRVRLCANDDHLWERVGESRRERGLHEGPAVLVRNGRVILVYSASGSWQHTYKLGLLYADAGADLLDPKSWHKLASPVFQSTQDVFGVGHCCFTTSPDGKEDWIAYHAKKSRREGWDREVHVQKFNWRDDGLPDFGVPVRAGVPIPVPAQPVPSEVPIPLHGAALPHSVAASPD